MRYQYNSILRIADKRFCAFCGNQINPDEHGAFHCQCNDAIQYRKALIAKLQLEIEASKVMANAPKPKFGLSTVCMPLKDIEPSQNNAPDDEPSVCV